MYATFRIPQRVGWLLGANCALRRISRPENPNVTVDTQIRLTAADSKENSARLAVVHQHAVNDRGDAGADIKAGRNEAEYRP